MLLGASSQLFGHLEKLSDVLGPSMCLELAVVQDLSLSRPPDAGIKLATVSEGSSGFGILLFHIINPEPFDFSVAQRIKELADLKNKKNSKSRKKRKQNTEDEGKGRHSMQGAERETALTSGRRGAELH